MTTFGKVLAVLNVIFALVFFIVVALDWGTRQAKTYPIFRREVMIHGLPVNDADTGWRDSGRPIAHDLGDDTLPSIFQNAGGGPELGGEPVATQETELTRVQPKVKASIEALGAEPKKKDRVRTILMDLAQTWEDRDAVAQKAANPKTTAQDLIADLDARFTQARAAGGEGDDEGKRRTIAHLLYNLSPAADWHTRVLAVVGLVTYARIADQQASEFVEMTRRVRELTDSERASFESEYRRIVSRILELADHVAHLEAVLTNEKDLLAKHNVLVKERNIDVKQLTAQRDQTRIAAVEALKEQTALELELFQAELTLAKVLKENLKLHAELRKIELGE